MKALTDTAEKLARYNVQNNNYQFKTADWDNNFTLDWANESERTKDLITKDFDIIQGYEKAFLTIERKAPINGDALILPTGETVYFCHTWDKSAQTTPAGSFCTLGGGMSYSGGLDSGVKLDDIYLTDEEAVLTCWFPHRGYLQAHSAIYAKIRTKVWRCKEGADLSGVQTKRNY